jgi:hypothetical protein
MEWISNAKFKQELTDGTIFRLKGREDVCIHTIHGLGKNFYLSCGRLGIQSFGLNTDDFNIAVENTKVIISEKLKMLNELYANFLANESNNVFVRY